MLLIICSALSANLSRSFTDAEQLYRSGNINEFASRLVKLRPNNDVERAFILYYTAIIEQEASEVNKKLEQLVKSLPHTYYGQMGYLILAKNAILDRNLEDAQAYLRKITHADITERLYWQAFCAFQNNDMNATLTNAENYLRLSRTSEYLEEAHYLITYAYLRKEKYSSAVSTLNKLQAIPGYPKDQQYFYYNLGYSYEQQGMIIEALQNYEKGYKVNKYSQLAFQIEDRLFEMRSRYGNAVDLGFLYEYTELAIVKEIGQDTLSVPPAVLPVELKLQAKPTSGLFLQAGRFTTEQSALRVVNQIRRLAQSGVYYEEIHNNKLTWVVLCGPFDQRLVADTVRALLIENGIDCFITILK